MTQVKKSYQGDKSQPESKAASTELVSYKNVSRTAQSAFGVRVARGESITPTKEQLADKHGNECFNAAVKYGFFEKA